MAARDILNKQFLFKSLYVHFLISGFSSLQRRLVIIMAMKKFKDEKWTSYIEGLRCTVTQNDTPERDFAKVENDLGTYGISSSVLFNKNFHL